MIGFKKLLLTSAILAASSGAMAMQAMDDESMSSTTGQDGLTIKLDVNMQNLNIRYIDRDGITTDGTYNNAGGLEITPIGISARNQVITIDAGGNAGDATGTEGQLRIGIQMGTLGNAADDVVIDLGGTTIGVADAGASGSALGATTNILSFDANAELRISAGANMTMRLGNRNGAYQAYAAAVAPVADSDPLTDGADGDGILTNDADQGYVAGSPELLERVLGEHLIQMTATIPSISLTGLTINDSVGGGEIGIGALGINNVSSNMGIDVVDNGLIIETTGTTLGSISLENVQLGTVDLSGRNNAIGDVYISGAGGAPIAMNNIITITGH